MFSQATPTAKPPVRATTSSAGYDFFSDEDFCVPARGQAIVSTGVYSHFKPDTVLFLKSRSGLAAKSCLSTEAGVIDSDYEGVIKVVLRNASDTDYHGKAGDKISQGVFLLLSMDYYPPEILETRGDGGFGSTGS